VTIDLILFSGPIEATVFHGMHAKSTLVMKHAIVIAVEGIGSAFSSRAVTSSV